MNRLQKKCVIASAGFHLLLLLVLVVGPAFFPGNKVQNTEVLTFFDFRNVTDGPTAGGGNPNAVPPPPQPQPRQIIQQTQPPKPTPQVREVAPQPEPDKKFQSNDKNPFAEQPPKKKIEVSTTVIKRNTLKNTSTNRDNSEAQAREQANKIASAFRNAASGLKSSLSKGTAFEMPGPGGQASVNWAQAVVSIYYEAWSPPDELDSSGEINTRVSVTIAADGDIVSARIVKPSGNTAADNSVQHALNRVRSVPAIPSASKDKQRTIVIIFNPVVKKQAG